MDEKRERARKEIKQSLPAFAIGAGLGLLSTLYDTYKLVATGANLSQFLGALCSLVAGVLVVLAVLTSKRALLIPGKMEYPVNSGQRTVSSSAVHISCEDCCVWPWISISMGFIVVFSRGDTLAPLI